MKPWIATLMLIASIQAAHAADCLQATAARYRAYGVTPAVLQAIVRNESSGNPHVVHRNADGSIDIGLMQINSSWLPTLRQGFALNARDLLDSCTNLQVGAWILARDFAANGHNWNAIGAYNVGCRTLTATECQRRRSLYAWKIYRQMPHPDSRRIVLSQADVGEVADAH